MLAELCWWNTGDAPQMAREMTLMRETRFERDLSDGPRLVREQHFGAFQPALNHISMHGHAHRVAKGLLELRQPQARHRGEFREPEIARQIVFYVGENQAQLVAGHTQALHIGLTRCAVAI